MANSPSSEHDLIALAHRCHRVVWDAEGLDPLTAFDELSKVIFAKFYDEKAHPQAPCILPGLRRSDPRLPDVVSSLLRESRTERQYAGIFAEDVTVQLSPPTLTAVLLELSQHSFVHTAMDVNGADIKGRLYEHVCDTVFRGKLGQFFTPGTIVDFVVSALGVTHEDTIMDPACGTGGFLIACAKRLRADLIRQGLPPDDAGRLVWERSAETFVGIEINERTARTARINMVMHNLQPSCIVHADALQAVDTGSTLRLEDNDDRRVGWLDRKPPTLILANPPFAGFEDRPRILDSYVLGRGNSRGPRAVTKEVLFLELIARLLAPDGRAGIVLPQGVLSNQSLDYVREFIRRRCQVIGVVEMPDWAFIPSGTSVRGSVLFLGGRGAPAQDRVYMKCVNAIGYDSTGRPTAANDLPATASEIGSASGEGWVPASELSERLDARSYSPEARRLRSLFLDPSRPGTVPLADLGSFDPERIQPRKLLEDCVLVVETHCVNPQTGTVSPTEMSPSEVKYGSLRVLRAGDILISRRRPYRAAIALVPPAADGALAIPEFSVLRPNPGVDPYYVLAVLRSFPVVRLLTLMSTGEMSGRVPEDVLKRLRLPYPPPPEQARTVRRLLARRRRLWNQMDQTDDEIRTLAETIALGTARIGTSNG